MLSVNLLLGVCLGYVILLFAVAFFVDRRSERRPAGWLHSPVVYTLSISVYCTSWTFYGAVGRATQEGLGFLPIYLGPLLVFIFGAPLLRRIIFISNRYARGIEATLLNLKNHGLTSANDIYLLRANRKDTKSNRRQEVSKGTGRLASHGAFKVLAWFGDAAHDFPDDPKLKWGTHKFMLPNPVYGNWDE